MKRLTIPALTILGLAAFFAGAAHRNTEVSSGAAIVNFNSVLASIPEYLANDSILGKEAMSYDAELQGLQAQLQQASDTYNQQALTMGPVQKDAAKKKLDAKADSLQKLAGGHRQKLAERRDDLLGKIEDRAISVIEGLRAEGNYSVVINVSSEANTVVAADKTVNITEKAIERLKTTGGKP